VAPSTLLLEPGGQSLHAVFEEAPVAVEYVPFVHLIQLDDEELPVVLLQVPVSQKSQVPLPLAD